MLVTDVYEGKNRTYVTGLDQDNGGAVKFSLPNDSVPDFPIMVPLDMELEVKCRTFQNNLDMQVVRMSVEVGAYNTVEDSGKVPA
jgi:hypothetical protein